MVDRDLVAAKLAELADRLSRVRAKCPLTAESFKTDRDALDLVSFNLMLAVQSCSDIACHIIADEGWSAPTTQASAYQQLHDQGVITKGTTQALSNAIGLRNVVAHGYAGINPAMVHAAATRSVEDLGKFAREVAAWMMARSLS